MRAKAMAALGVAAYLVFLLAAAPASFVAARASAAAPGQIELSEARGTLWNGAAHARIDAPGGLVTFERVEWRFAPARLMAGRVAFDVRAAGPGLDAQGQIARGLTVWELRDASARGEIAALTPFAPFIATWRPEGSVAISAPRLEWNDANARGDLSIEWKDAAVSISEVRPLGTYRVDAHGEGGPAKVALATLGGPLRISAQGTFSPPSRLALSGEARADTGAAQALQPLLDLLGPRRPDGARALEIRMN
jgi:general secretion pathway protein N